jgi:hypothetical protein
MLVVGGAAALVVAACGPEEPAEPAPGTELELPDETAEEEATEEPIETPVEEPAEDPGTEEPAAEVPEEDAAAPDPDDDLEPIDGEATTEASDEGEFGTVAVTDVRVATHPGFDRLVFEIDGDGLAGWDLRYVDEATSQGRGEPIEVDGEAILAVALQNVTLPPDLPEEIDRWDEPQVDGPSDGVIAEIVHDTIFEGVQTFFVGLDDERPFLIERFEEPQRVVIDIPSN